MKKSKKQKKAFVGFSKIASKQTNSIKGGVASCIVTEDIIIFKEG